MSMMFTDKKIFQLALSTLGLCLLAVGCGQAPSEGGDQISVRVFDPLVASSCADLYAARTRIPGDPIGGTSPMKSSVYAASSRTKGDPIGGTYPMNSFVFAASSRTKGDPIGGTKPMMFAQEDLSCDNYVLQVSGSTANIDALLVELGGASYSLSIDASESTFTFFLAAEDLETFQEMTLTPMVEGELLSHIDVTDLL